jgi:hypothetical protein
VKYILSQLISLTRHRLCRKDSKAGELSVNASSKAREDMNKDTSTILEIAKRWRVLKDPSQD